MNILQLIDPMIAATNPYNTMLGMSRAIDGVDRGPSGLSHTAIFFGIFGDARVLC